jgi:hypothetical protein
LKGWKRDGLTDEQIAHNMGIGMTTFYRWQTEHGEFREALKKGREVADYEVVNALFKRATGYEYNKKISEIHYRTIKGKRVETSRIDRVTIEQVAPDTGAAIYWTKNRMADRWRDKPVDTMDEEAIAKLKEALAGVHSAID